MKPRQIRKTLYAAARPFAERIIFLDQYPKLQKTLDNLLEIRQDFLDRLDYCQNGPAFLRGQHLTEREIQREFILVLKDAERHYHAVETAARKYPSPSMQKYQTEIETIMKYIRSAVGHAYPFSVN